MPTPRSLVLIFPCKYSSWRWDENNLTWDDGEDHNLRDHCWVCKCCLKVKLQALGEALRTHLCSPASPDTSAENFRVGRTSEVSQPPSNSPTHLYHEHVPVIESTMLVLFLLNQKLTSWQVLLLFTEYAFLRQQRTNLFPSELQCSHLLETNPVPFLPWTLKCYRKTLIFQEFLYQTTVASWEIPSTISRAALQLKAEAFYALAQETAEWARIIFHSLLKGGRKEVRKFCVFKAFF